MFIHSYLRRYDVYISYHSLFAWNVERAWLRVADLVWLPQIGIPTVLPQSTDRWPTQLVTSSYALVTSSDAFVTSSF